MTYPQSTTETGRIDEFVRYRHTTYTELGFQDETCEGYPLTYCFNLDGKQTMLGACETGDILLFGEYLAGWRRIPVNGKKYPLFQTQSDANDIGPWALPVKYGEDIEFRLRVDLDMVEIVTIKAEALTEVMKEAKALAGDPDWTPEEAN